ncbi:MAG: XisI protein [Calothrix sp. MO_192.B10]|nr:XisI protein [Calothrix sp. MO_192.B10]
MDFPNVKYREAVEKTLSEYADFLGNDEEVKIQLVFDRENNHYLLVETGWQNGYRIYGTLLHVDIIENKLFIQHDGTESGIAVDLVAKGIPKEDIILGFRPEQERQNTEFCVS